MVDKVPNKAFKANFSGDNHADLSMKDGHIEVTQGKEEWLQANKFGVVGQEGDWRFAPTEGLPWVDNGKLPAGTQSILGYQPPTDTQLIEVYIYQQLIKEPRNRTVDNIEVEWKDKKSRSMSASAEITSIEGDLIEVNYPRL